MPPIPKVSFERFTAACDNLTLLALEPPREYRERRRGEDSDIEDPRLDWLEAEWETYGYGSQGQLHLRCPFVDDHTSGFTESECSYFPAGTNDYQQGHYVCLHATCQARRGDADFDEAVGYGMGDFDVVEANGHAHDEAPTGGDALVQALAPKFNRDKQGRIEATLPNLIDALRAPEWTGTAFAVDSFREEIVVSPHGRQAWRTLRDHDPVRLREWLERRGFKPIGREVMRDALLRVAEDNRFDSATLWLNGLKWDGTERIATFLSDHFGCEDSPYVRAVARYWWTGHAARVLDPGHRCDMVPILVSPEGRYKSSTLQALVPAFDNFIEIDLDHKDDDLSRKMRGALLGELAELRGLRGRSAEANKAWVTRRWEEWTPKYQENKVRLARRLMFVGTTNETAFLDGTTGRRRWLPVIVHRAIDTKGIAAIRDQLWAEGAAAFKLSGEVEWQAAYELAPAVHSDHVIEDVWQTAIERWLESGEESVMQHFTLEHVFVCALGRSAEKVSRVDRDRMADVLRAINYESKSVRIDGKVMWRWTKAK